MNCLLPSRTFSTLASPACMASSVPSLGAGEKSLRTLDVQQVGADHLCLARGRQRLLELAQAEGRYAREQSPPGLIGRPERRGTELLDGLVQRRLRDPRALDSELDVVGDDLP